MPFVVCWLQRGIEAQVSEEQTCNNRKHVVTEARQDEINPRDAISVKQEINLLQYRLNAKAHLSKGERYSANSMLHYYFRA